MTDVKEAAREAESSTTVAWLARFGLVCRGIVWSVVGLLAVQVALGDNTQADKHGALRTIAEKPLGEGLLVLLAAGFLGYACWRLLEGAVGHRDEDEPKRTAKRTASLFRGGLYLVLAGSTAKFLFNQDSHDPTKPLTARVMSEPGGRTLVLVVGVGLVIGGVVIGIRGIRQKFEKLVEGWKMPDGLRPVMKVVATMGLVSRGFVFALVGGFLVNAAIHFEPDEAKGLDDSLKTLAAQPFGQVMLFAAAVGLLAFGLWSFIEARYRKF